MKNYKTIIISVTTTLITMFIANNIGFLILLVLLALWAYQFSLLYREDDGVYPLTIIASFIPLAPFLVGFDYFAEDMKTLWRKMGGERLKFRNPIIFDTSKKGGQ